MAEPFLAEVRIFSFNFPPKGWAFCNGQLLPINQNQALFALLGTAYGGNGQTNFALPNLQGRAALHYVDSPYTIGTNGGETFHTLTISEMPQHNHTMSALPGTGSADISGITPGATKAPAQALVSLQGGGTNQAQLYGTGAIDGAMAPSTITNSGGSQPHENRQPYLALNFCIALQGIFPSQN
ncbi:phage tail protein [Sphingosinicella sp. BN140058]|uniref:phage tail protein n=1 Tax=Sphingosinicella sp. BN140058 TaxID=1892855 RepID=UPI0010120C6A|nr:tail fiber protein [Sphingosinicella sp. BN140058]QAY77375.1 phage tail protein [Sphingosinicella sp. BN140058]